MSSSILKLLNTAPKYHSKASGPDLADQHKVGFFGLDRSSQTDVTEIVDLKEMTEVLQILLQDVATLKRDINFAKHVMQADYESKLQEKSTELYCRINERVAELERMHEERVGTVRRAFRQQLSDAIARIAVLYNKNLQRNLRSEKNKQDGDAWKNSEKFKEMQATIQRNESIIHMLKMQIGQLQNKDMSLTESFEESAASKSPSINHEAENLKEELEHANNRIEQLVENLQLKDDETNKLATDINSVRESLKEEQAEKLALQLQIDGMKDAIESDKQNAQKMAKGLEAQKAEMERQMLEKLKAQQAANSEALEADAAKLMREKDKMSYLEDQERILKAELARERKKLTDALSADSDMNSLRKSEDALRTEVTRLKREIERIHRTWEKKFAILQQSLHALKDESYIRQTLQRQAANLHHAAVSYSVDTPLGIHPSKQHTSPTKRPLPDIHRYNVPNSKGYNPNANPSGPGDKDYISYTVSAPSGRGTALFSADENQIMSENDKEDIPADVIPLPERPPRNSPATVPIAEGVETIINPTNAKQIKSHVIVIPQVT